MPSSLLLLPDVPVPVRTWEIIRVLFYNVSRAHTSANEEGHHRPHGAQGGQNRYNVKEEAAHDAGLEAADHGNHLEQEDNAGGHQEQHKVRDHDPNDPQDEIDTVLVVVAPEELRFREQGEKAKGEASVTGFSVFFSSWGGF